jgi:hypothetical protein
MQRTMRSSVAPALGRRLATISGVTAATSSLRPIGSLVFRDDSGMSPIVIVLRGAARPATWMTDYPFWLVRCDPFTLADTPSMSVRPVGNAEATLRHARRGYVVH